MKQKQTKLNTRKVLGLPGEDGDRAFLPTRANEGKGSWLTSGRATCVEKPLTPSELGTSETNQEKMVHDGYDIY